MDARLVTALNDPKSGVNMLNELNQQITTCRDSRMISELLSKYLTIASARAVPPPTPLAPLPLRTQIQFQRESRIFSAISNIMKTAHDTAQNSITNIR